MKHLVKNLAVVTTLGATAFLLIADSHQECPHPAQSARFAVSGTCGPEGTLRVDVPTDQCNFQVAGAEELGLPSYGYFNGEGAADDAPYDLYEGGWSLSNGDRSWNAAPDGGWIETDGGSGQLHGGRECKATRENGVLRLRCEDTGYEASSSTPTVISRCEAVLTPN